jgi:hypothetical protein
VPFHNLQLVTVVALMGCAYAEHHDAGYGYGGGDYDGGHGDGGYGHGHGHAHGQHAGYGPQVHYQPAVAKVAVPAIEKHVEYYVS